MIEYLEKLIADREYQKALDYAEQLMLEGDHTLQDLLNIYSAIQKSRVELGEYHAAVVSGHLAVKIARDLGDWDRYGHATFLLGATHGWLRQTDEWILWTYEYLSQLQYYATARDYEANAWYNLGLSHAERGNDVAASQALQKAMAVALRTGKHYLAHCIRHALIKVSLRAQQLDGIPQLLARSGHYLRVNSTAPYFADSRLWHYVLRVEFAIGTKRLQRAAKVASRGLKYASDRPLFRFYLLMCQARLAWLNGDLKDAVGQALAARVCAVQCRRFELEADAADFMYEVLRAYSNGLETVDLAEVAPSVTHMLFDFNG